MAPTETWGSNSAPVLGQHSAAQKKPASALLSSGTLQRGTGAPSTKTIPTVGPKNMNTTYFGLLGAAGQALSGPQKNVKEWPVWLFIMALGHDFTYFGGVQVRFGP